MKGIDIVYRFLFPPLFFMMELLVRKKKGLIVLTVPRGHLYEDNTRYLFEYCMGQKDLNVILITKNKQLCEKINARYPGKARLSFSRKGLLCFLRARCVFITNGKYDLFPFYPLKQFKTYVNLWHGTPLKRVNYLNYKSNRDYGTDTRFCKYICTSSEFTKYLMATQFRMHIDNMWVTGQPRNDTLFSEDTTLADEHPVLKKNVVLYATTFREEGATNFFPFKDFDPQVLIKFLNEEDIYILMRCHINEWENFKKQIPKELQETDRIVMADSSHFPSVHELLKYTDVLVTDYSSIYFDYLILNRPIVFLPYDYEAYEKSRGFNVDYYANTPGPYPDTMASFINAIKQYIDDPSIDQEKRTLIQQKYNGFIDAKASERIVAKVKEII
jgi:CDP-glycerol glycerophosphotransferase (TagB/SpsB family)